MAFLKVKLVDGTRALVNIDSILNVKDGAAVVIETEDGETYTVENGYQYITNRLAEATTVV